MGLFSSSSKSSSTSVSTDAGTQTGDESIGLTVTGGTVSVSSDTPGVLKYLVEKTSNVAGQQLDASLEQARLTSEQSSQLNLSLAEGLKELNLRATETKAATTTARNIIIAAVLVVFALVLFLRSKTKNST